jgi:hypothetical protein
MKRGDLDPVRISDGGLGNIELDVPLQLFDVVPYLMASSAKFCH